ncbi:MAG TPA: hypothetical protein VIT44_08910 [Cyclobacteriaceae bacterium]
MNFSCKVFVFTFLFVPILLSAQDFRPGYIIKNNGDSISGLVSYRLGKKNTESCSFKSAEKSDPILFTAGDLLRYGFIGDRSYESIIIKQNGKATNPVFAKVLARGPITLYRLGEIFVLKKNDSLVVLPTPEDKLVKVGNEEKVQRDKRYVRILNSAMGDCAVNANEVSYAEGPLQKVVRKYNKCKGVVVEEAKLPSFIHLNFFAFGNFTRSALDVSNTSLSPSNTFGGGGGIDISSPRVFDRAFISVELWYSKIFYQGLHTGTVNSSLLYQDVLLDISSYKIPIGLRYNFFNENSTPYIKVGFSLTYVNKYSLRTLEEQVGPDKTVYSSASTGYNDYEVKRNPKSIWVSVGYSKEFFKRMRAFTEFRFETGEGYIGTEIQNYSTLKNYNFLVGIRF